MDVQMESAPGANVHEIARWQTLDSMYKEVSALKNGANRVSSILDMLK